MICDGSLDVEGGLGGTGEKRRGDVDPLQELEGGETSKKIIPPSSSQTKRERKGEGGV